MVTTWFLPSGNLGSIEEGRQAEPSVGGAHGDTRSAANTCVLACACVYMCVSVCMC